MPCHLLKFCYALGVRLFVYAVHGRKPRGLQVGCYRFISRQHEFFDNAVREITRRARNAGHGAPLVEFDQGLRQIEIDRAATHALTIEDQGKFPHQLETRDQGGIPRAQAGIAIEQ